MDIRPVVHGRAGRATALLVGLAVTATVAGTASAVTPTASRGAAAASSGGVAVPSVSGPVRGGSRTGLPQASPVYDLAPYGYVEKEYFLSGTATSAGVGGLTDVAGAPAAGTKAPYTTRLDMVLPPKATFNGTVVVEWANVTLQMDDMYTSYQLHDHLMREGFGMAFVSAQKQGVDGSPTSLTGWDPVRYGSLVHPGDAYSYDIFSQAVAALRRNGGTTVDPMEGRRVTQAIAVGSSQSCGTLHTYLDTVAQKHRVVDGVLAHICSAAVEPGRRTVVPSGGVPALWVNSESETGSAVPVAGQQATTDVPGPDQKEFRIWEVAGSSHVENYAITQVAATHGRDQASVGGTVTPGIGWNPNAERQYGEKGSRPCSNLMPMHYATIGALEALRGWIRTGRPAKSERFTRDSSGRLVRDQFGNVKGGVRLPPVEVPVATYSGNDCGALDGSTYKLDPLRLSSLYPTHADYVRKMEAATRRAEKAGWMLAPEADEMVQLARSAPIPR